MIIGLPETENLMRMVKAEFDAKGGLEQVFFVACGGSFSSSYPARFLLNQESSLRVQAYTSNEFVYATPKTVNQNSLVIATSTKATPETVEALRIANSKGAITIGLTGYADSLTARTSKYHMIYHHKDEWYSNPSLIHCNSQGTALKIAFWLLKHYDSYTHYDDALQAFESMPKIYENAYQYVKADTVKFALAFKDDKIWNVLGSGAAWEVAYADAFCFLEEMQTIHCVPVHSGEYLHGAFETCDKNLPILLIKSAGRTRALDERVERFLDQFAGRHWVIDGLELGLNQVDANVVDYFNALLLHPISKQYVTALSDVRMHPMSHRRYMWKFEY